MSIVYNTTLIMVCYYTILRHVLRIQYMSHCLCYRVICDKRRYYRGFYLSSALIAERCQPVARRHQVIKFLLGSHDQIGCRKNGGHNHETNMVHRHGVHHLGGRWDWDARARSRMWYAMQCTGQGIPMAFMVSPPPPASPLP